MDQTATIVFSAIISIIVAYATAKASNYSKDVVGERREWREKIRSLAVEADQLIRLGSTQSQRFQEIFAEFRLRLNPDDHDDNDILDTLKESMSMPNNVLGAKLLAQVSRLLKYDWERAKAESRMLGLPSKPNEREIRRLKSGDYLGSPPK